MKTNTSYELNKLIHVDDNDGLDLAEVNFMFLVWRGELAFLAHWSKVTFQDLLSSVFNFLFVF